MTTTADETYNTTGLSAVPTCTYGILALAVPTKHLTGSNAAEAAHRRTGSNAAEAAHRPHYPGTGGLF